MVKNTADRPQGSGRQILGRSAVEAGHARLCVSSQRTTSQTAFRPQVALEAAVLASDREGQRPNGECDSEVFAPKLQSPSLGRTTPQQGHPGGTSSPWAVPVGAAQLGRVRDELPPLPLAAGQCWKLCQRLWLQDLSVSAALDLEKQSMAGARAQAGGCLMQLLQWCAVHLLAGCATWQPPGPGGSWRCLCELQVWAGMSAAKLKLVAGRLDCWCVLRQLHAGPGQTALPAACLRAGLVAGGRPAALTAPAVTGRRLC